MYKELLIVEKLNDGKPFELHTSNEDKISYYKNWRNIWLTYFALFALMSLIFLFNPIVSIVLGALGICALIPVIAYQVQIGKIKKQSNIEE